jgi:ubiquinone biosynthesis protein UbiJ
MQTGPTRVIDLKLPLSWLIGTAGVMVTVLLSVTWNASAQTRNLENKIDQLIGTSSKLEKRLDDRDTRIEDVRDRMFMFERKADNLQLRVESLERDRIKK